MPNEETNRLQLVEETTIGPSLFRKTIVPASGYSREAFRNGQHMGSVRLISEAGVSPESGLALVQLKVREGDKVLTVNLGPCLTELKGDFYTSDSYTASYEVKLELRVNNPALFALRYLQKSDPVGLLLSAITQEFDSYAARTSHDQLSKVKLRYDARYNVQSQKVGVVVTEIYQSEIYADPRRARINELKQEAEVKRSEITITSEVDALRFKSESVLNTQRKQYERDETRKDKEFEREQAMQDQDLQLMQNLKQEQIAQFSALMINEMVGKMDAGTTVNEVIANNPLLANAFAAVLQYGNAALSPGKVHEQLKGPTEVKEVNPALPSATPPDKENAPKVPIPESDSAEFREIDGEVTDDEEDEE